MPGVSAQPVSAKAMNSAGECEYVYPLCLLTYCSACVLIAFVVSRTSFWMASRSAAAHTRFKAARRAVSPPPCPPSNDCKYARSTTESELTRAADENDTPLFFACDMTVLRCAGSVRTAEKHGHEGGTGTRERMNEDVRQAAKAKGMFLFVPCARRRALCASCGAPLVCARCPCLLVFAISRVC
jgi:hypothetical protein